MRDGRGERGDRVPGSAADSGEAGREALITNDPAAGTEKQRPRRPRGRQAELTRLRQIVSAAERAFAEWGLTRTQITDIAQEAGVSPGSIYRYAASKDALFDLALRGAIHADDTFLPFLANVELPYEISPIATFEHLEACADWRARFPRLAAALGQTAAGDAASPGGPDALDRIIDALWLDLRDLRTVIRIVSKSSREWPALALLYFSRVREPMLASLAFRLERAHERGEILLEHSPLATARHMLGFTAWSAVHRAHDGGGVAMLDDECRAITRQLLTHGVEPID